MALDGAFLRHIKNEIESVALNSRIDKIYQPNKEEFVFSLRGKASSYKLLMSTRANSARIHFTKFLPENPISPPMLCMLFRKKLLGAKLVKVRQPNLERVLYLDFLARNELGDEVKLTLVIEIMGKYSNVILIDSKGKIIDALKRVDELISSKRQVLPKIKYKLPPKQEKLSLITDDVNQIEKKVNLLSKVCGKSISETVLSVIAGISPIVCNKIEWSLENNKSINLAEELSELKTVIENYAGRPFIVFDGDRPKDFSFIEPTHMSNLKIKRSDSFSELLDDFFAHRDSIDRMKIKSYALRKQVNNVMLRLKKKIKIQKIELENNKVKDNLKLFADLINANLYKIKNKESEVVLENFYDENLRKIKIKLDPMLTPIQNAEKFYKDYKKSKVALQKLEEEINKAKQEILYLDTVLDEVDRARNESDLIEIKNELTLGGYIKLSKVKNEKIKALTPIEYNLCDGVKVLVGRNNHQNDKLTLKIASKKDLWFHVKDMPGSHTILTGYTDVMDERILLKAAQIAVYHSKARDSSNVAVDFALVKDVKKPVGAKPGMVIYKNYRTLFVTLDDKFVEEINNF